jgi:hypothetical protein
VVTADETRHSDSAIVAGSLVVAAFLVSFGALHYGLFTKNLLLDTPLYEKYGDAIVHGGKIPYRDFGLEYPPGALPVFALPSLIAPRGDWTLYSRLFEGLMLLCGAVASALVAFVLARQGASTRRLVAGTLLAGLAPLALGPVVLSRFDLWPAALTVGALAALVANRRTTAFVVLAVAIAAKVYPVVLVPLAAAYVWRLYGRRAAVTGGAVLAGTVALCFVPFLIASPSGVWASFSGQASRPLQIESLGASVLLAAHQLWGLPLTEVASHGSDNLSGGAAGALASAQAVLALGALVTLWVLFARGRATPERLLRYSVAAVCAFVALNKVLSPQYLIWLFALVPLLRGRRGVAAGALFVAAMILTQLWFPRHYIALVYGLDPRASWFVVARDVVLVALLLTLLLPARRAAVAVVAGLAAAAAAAAALGASSSVATSLNMHSGLLTETGVASSCGNARPAPPSSPGTVAYDTWDFAPPSAGRTCVTVGLTAAGRAQLFTVAYRPRFEASNPRAGYLGDAGRCTNLDALAGRRVGYSLEVPRRSPFAVEVESCGPGTAMPAYTLDVSGGGRPPAAFASAGAARHTGVVAVGWRTTAELPGTTFRVYRQDGDARIPVTTRTVTGRGPAGGTYLVDDRLAPLVRPLRYWVLARSPAGAWAWHGPITSRG